MSWRSWSSAGRSWRCRTRRSSRRGDSRVVYVQRATGEYMPQEIQTGFRASCYTQDRRAACRRRPSGDDSAASSSTPSTSSRSGEWRHDRAAHRSDRPRAVADRRPLVAAGVVASVYAIRTASLDAIPDISDPQIVVYVKWPRSPQLLESRGHRAASSARWSARRRSGRSAARRTWATRSSTSILNSRRSGATTCSSWSRTGSTPSGRSCRPTRSSRSARTPAAWAGSTNTR